MSFLGALFGAGQRRQPQNELNLTLDTSAPRRLIIGKGGTAGAFVFHGLSDSDGRQREGDNRFLHRVIAIAGHRCNGCTRVWADGEAVVGEGETASGVANPGPLQHGVRTEIPEFRDGRRARAWLTWYDGRPGQLADPFLRGQFILPEMWRFSDRMDGLAYIIATFQFDRDVLTQPPELQFEIEGARLYDRRRDTSVGGDGPQRWDEPESWIYTENPAVAADHYQLGIVGGANNDQIIFGMGLQPWQVPLEEFIANADLCDERVPLPGGRTQARYAANGLLLADQEHRDNIARLATAMAAQVFDTGGQVIIRPQQARPIIMTLTDEDVVSDSADLKDPFPSRTDLVNLVRGSYLEPATRFNEEQYPQVRDDALIASDGGPSEHTLDLDLEIDVTRAQRLATIELEVQKRRGRIEETFMPIANRLEVGDWFERITSKRNAQPAIYEVIEKRVNRDLTVDVTARTTDPGIVFFDVDQAKPIELPQPFARLGPALPAPPVADMQGAEATSNGAVLPVAAVTLSPLDDNTFNAVDFFEVEYGLSNGLSGAALGISGQPFPTLRFENDGNLSFEIPGLMPGSIYAARWRSGVEDLVGNFGPFVEFTSTDQIISTAANMAAPGGPLDTSLKDLTETFSNTASTLENLDAANQAAALAASDAQTAANAARDAAIAVAQDVATQDSEINALVARATGIESDIVTNQQAITDLDNSKAETSSLAAATTRLTDVETAQTGQAQSIQSALTRVEQAESDIQVFGQNVNVLAARAETNANLLPNSTGALGIQFWDPGNTGLVAADDPVFGRHFRLTGSLQNVTVAFSDRIGVRAGATYTLSADLLRQADSGQLEMDVQVLDSAGNTILDGPQGTLFLTTQTDFSNAPNARGSVTFTTPPGAVEAIVRIFTVNMVNPVSVGVRRIKFELGSVATAWSDDATAVQTAATITQVEQVTAELSGRTEAFLQRSVSVGSGSSNLILRAVDENGQQVNVAGLFVEDAAGNLTGLSVDSSTGIVSLVGNVQVDGALLVSETITSLQMQPNSITNREIAQDADVTRSNFTSFFTVASRSITTSGGFVAVRADADIRASNSTASGGAEPFTIFGRLRRRTGTSVVTLREVAMISSTAPLILDFDSGAAGSVSISTFSVEDTGLLFFDEKPPAGTHTYEFQVRVTAINTTITARSPQIVVTEHRTET